MSFEVVFLMEPTKHVIEPTKHVIMYGTRSVVGPKLEIESVALHTERLWRIDRLNPQTDRELAHADQLSKVWLWSRTLGCVYPKSWIKESNLAVRPPLTSKRLESRKA